MSSPSISQKLVCFPLSIRLNLTELSFIHTSLISRLVLVDTSRNQRAELAHESYQVMCIIQRAMSFGDQ